MTGDRYPAPIIPIDRTDLAARVALFAVAVFVCREVGVLLFSPLSIFWTAALTTFFAGAVANGLLVFRYGTAHLSEIGLGFGTAHGDRRVAGSFPQTSLGQGIAGWAIGFGAAALMLGGSAFAGLAEFQPLVPDPAREASISFATAFFALLVGSFGEELMFRGYGFQLLARTFGLLPPAIPVSLLFGLAHAGNSNVSLIALANTAAWGLLLSFAYWRTRSLWLPIGMHFGWNLALPLLGVRLSGFTMEVTGYVLAWQVDDLWSGGDYGPEGGLITSMVVVALFAALRVLLPPASSLDRAPQETATE